MAALVVAEDTLTGMNHIIAAITTPVATPTGMTTYGLDIVVKFGVFSLLLRLVAWPRSLISLALPSHSCSLPSIISLSHHNYSEHILTTCKLQWKQRLLSWRRRWRLRWWR